MSEFSIFFSSFVVLTCMLHGTCAAQTTRPTLLAIEDLDGAIHHPLDVGDGLATVIIFTGTECPISNTYAPMINRMCEQCLAHKIAFYIVHSEATLSAADARKHAKAFAITCPVLLDRTHALARQLGATITPEAAVVGRNGKLLYLGRIDDSYITLGQRRYEPTTHDLQDAIDAIIAGKAVPTPRTKAVGCTIGD